MKNKHETTKQEVNKQELKQTSNINVSKPIYYINVINNIELGKYYLSTNYSDTYTRNQTALPQFFSTSSSSTIFPKNNIIYIPKGVKKIIKNKISFILARKNKIDKQLAIEVVYIFLNQLIDTYFTFKNEGENNGKKLMSKYLQNTFQGICSYKEISELLLNNDIIYIDNSYIPNERSKTYFIKNQYLKNIEKIELFHQKSKDILAKKQNNQLNQNINNPIISNLIEVYKKIQLPTETEIHNEAKRIISEGKPNKKNQILKYKLRNESRDKNTSKSFTYVEDAVFRYNYLFNDELWVPTVGGEYSGGRVTDRLNLINSWIRRLFRIDNEKIIELDFKSFHPCIASTLYGSGNKITHEMIADYYNESPSIIKKEHLSFFNVPVNNCTINKKKYIGMKNFKIYKWYEENEPEMLMNIINAKNSGSYKNGFKNTTKCIFKKEVQIMTEIISELNNKHGIYCIYVYDALYVKESVVDTVRNVMNQIVLKHGVNTSVS